MMRIEGLLALAFLLAGVAGARAQECDAGVVDLRDGANSLRFQVEVADTVESRASGLMDREEMGRFAGMLFVYDAPQPVAFWMKNTLIPLDMLFFDETGKLMRVHKNALPLDETPVPGGNNILYVLEINGGLAGQLGIEAGAELRHPAIARDLAAWPCPPE